MVNVRKEELTCVWRKTIYALFVFMKWIFFPNKKVGIEIQTRMAMFYYYYYYFL